MTASPPTRFRFGAFEIGTSAGVLTRAGTPIALPRRAALTLLALLRRRGEVVSKEQLLAVVWAGLFVEENNLEQCVSALRKALGDSAAAPRYVETVARRGYRFLAAVEESAEEPVEAAPRVRELAVLPLRSGGDPQLEYLGSGLADSLVARLSEVPGLNVRSSAATARFTAADRDPLAVATALGVDAVVDGAIHQLGERLRVSVELVRARDGVALWAGRLDERLDDLFAVEDRLTARLLAALSGRLAETPPVPARRSTTDVQAYQLYLRGRHLANHLRPDNFRDSVECFARATEIDPGYALAYAGLAYSYLNAVDLHLPPGEAMPRAREAAARALALDPAQPEALACLAAVAFWYDWDFAASERTFREALQLAPGLASTERLFAWILVAAGRREEALARMARAASQDPYSLENHLYESAVLFMARQYDESLAVARTAQHLFPEHWLGYVLAGRSREQQGDLGGARDELERAHQVAPTEGEVLGELGRIAALGGQRERARQILHELEAAQASRHVAPFNRALVHLGLGELDAVFALLEESFRQRSWYLTWLGEAPQLDALRADPRFPTLRGRVGLSGRTAPGL